MAESTTQVPARADYGLDAPGVVRTLAVLGIVLVVAAFAWPVISSSQTLAHVAVHPTLLWMGCGLLAGSALMVASSRWGKRRAAESLVNRLGLLGGEIVLDVGCGHGLMLITAARRLTTGKAVGVDIWSQVDQMNNSSSATIANARAEGVADRVEVRDGDMRALPLDDSSVDVVLSCLAIHNVRGSDDRRKAIREIVRVLKSGGRVGILDIANVSEYADELRNAGMSSVRTHGITPWIYPPTRVLTAVK